MAAWGKKSQNSARTTSSDYADPEGFGADPAVNPDNYVRPVVPQVSVLPYRGMEYHGVNPNLAGDPPDINANVFDQTAVVPEPQAPPERHEVPVPVRIVKGKEDWEQTFFRTSGWLLSAAPVRVVGHMQTRTNCIITNNGTVAILVSADQQPAQPNSVSVAAGGSFTTTGQNSIYAVSVDGSPQNVSVLEEYTVSAERKPSY